VAAGALEIADAVQARSQAWRYMQDAVPAGVGAMAAIMGLSPAVVADACKPRRAGRNLFGANLNSPDQTVISGHGAAVKRAVEIASQLGASARDSRVSAPFHSALMMPAQEKLGKRLEANRVWPVARPACHQCGCRTIEPATKPAHALIRQVTMPVRWESPFACLIDEGVKHLCGTRAGRGADRIVAANRTFGGHLKRRRRKKLAATVEKSPAPVPTLLDPL